MWELAMELGIPREDQKDVEILDAAERGRNIDGISWYVLRFWYSSRDGDHVT